MPLMWQAVSGGNNRGHFENAGVHDMYIKGALLPRVYSGFFSRGNSRSQVNAIVFPLSITSLLYKWCTDQHDLLSNVLSNDHNQTLSLCITITDINSPDLLFRCLGP